MQQTIPWILASASLALLAGAALVWLWRRPRTRLPPLPDAWALAARPVFSSSERRLFRQLRAALPGHIVLSKLPLVRFCQPLDPESVRYWYELLGSHYVSFAICSTSGRVQAAIDIESERELERPNMQRATHIKAAVLTACRVRHLRCTPDRLPSIPELQMLVPHGVAAAPAPASPPAQAPAERTRATLWQESGFMQDSFLGLDGRTHLSLGASANAFANTLIEEPTARVRPPTVEEVGGVVIDTPVSPLRH